MPEELSNPFGASPRRTRFVVRSSYDETRFHQRRSLHRRVRMDELSFLWSRLPKLSRDTYLSWRFMRETEDDTYGKCLFSEVPTGATVITEHWQKDAYTDFEVLWSMLEGFDPARSWSGEYYLHCRERERAYRREPWCLGGCRKPLKQDRIYDGVCEECEV